MFGSYHRLVPVSHPVSRPVSTQLAHRNIYGSDRVALVGFHDRAFVIARLADVYAPWLQERSSRLHEKVAGTGTNITDGLRTAIDIVRSTPAGLLRRIWLLSDGYPNREMVGIDGVVRDAVAAHVNINTIGFGDSFDEALLRRIAGHTHNGKFFSVRSLRELTQALVIAGGDGSGRNRRNHRSEATVLALDLSRSMLMPMEGKTKVRVLEEAILHLLKFKQACFS